MGLGYGLIRGASDLVRGAQAGARDKRELERQAREDEQKALHEALARKLLEAQIAKMNAPPPPRPRAAHFDPELNRVVYTSEEGPAKVEQLGPPRQRAETPRNIDPLSEEGIAAAAKREKAIAGAVPPTQRRPVASIVQKVAANKAQLSALDAALQGLQKRPEGVGLQYGIADALNQRMDPKGVKLRADIADIGSLKIHDRSGAAVTVSEAPRLKPFIPLVTDTPEAARIKLQRLRELLLQETSFLEQSPADADATEGMIQPERGASQPARVKPSYREWKAQHGK